MKPRPLLRQPEFQFFIYCLLFVLMNWPFLAITASHGLESLFKYVFFLWGICILLMVFICRRLSSNGSGETGEKRGDGDV